MITIDLNKFSTKPGYKILDIGCGEGRHTGGVYELKGVTAIGADLCFEDLLKAKDRLRYHDEIKAHGGGNWGLTVADITKLPFRDNYFDVVICSEVLEHIPDEKKAMEEIIRVLKPDHPLIVSVPRYWPEKICWALSDEYHTVENGHIRIYKEKEITLLLEKFGVKKWGKHFAHSLHSPYWWLKCFVGPHREDSVAVNLYNRFLTWDIMKKPWITRFFEWLLNPILGKSLVLYFRKNS